MFDFHVFLNKLEKKWLILLTFLLAVSFKKKQLNNRKYIAVFVW